MTLKPQDVLVALKLVALSGGAWTYSSLSQTLDMSSSQVHDAVKRLVKAQLVLDSVCSEPNIAHLKCLLGDAFRFMFVAEIGEPCRGMPTAYGAKPLVDAISQGADPLPVWCCPEGTQRGFSVKPLYRSVPAAAQRDEKLYALLALVDAIRIGKTRERKMARAELEKQLDGYHDRKPKY